MPKKPTSPAGHWVFPKEGAPYLVSDQLPDTAEEIEAYVVERFAERIRALGHDVAVQPRPEGEWPDAALTVDGMTVGVELVEVVDAEHRRHVADEAWLLERFREAVSAHGLETSLAGMELHFSDGYGGLPPARSRDARSLVETMVAKVAEEAGHLAASEVNIVRRLEFSAPPWDLSLWGWRVAEGADGYVLRGASGYLVDPNNLVRAIAKKVASQYTSGSGFDSLWLLAWDSFGYLLAGGEDDPRPVALLEHAEHPFDKVWTCYLAGGPAVFVDRLWPGQGPERAH